MAKSSSLTFLFGLAAVIMVIAFSFFYVRLANINHLIIVHFESLRGVDVLGSKKEVIGILISGLALNIVNFLLAAFLYNRQRLFSYLIGLINIFISLLILLTILAIISVN